MQRDFDLVVTILGALRDASTASLSLQALQHATLEPTPDDDGLPLLTYHLDLLTDAGLVKPLEIASATQWRLTWKGHDALEQNETDEDDEDDTLEDEDYDDEDAQH